MRGPPLPSSLSAIARLPRALAADVEVALDLARRFNEQVVEPSHEKIDRHVTEDPTWVPRSIVRAASEWGLFTAWLPRVFGGRGLNMLSLYFFLEEVATVCVGIANVVGVHYLGVATLCATWNTRLMRRLLADVVAGERRGEPCLVSLAITEPGAGTDMEETALLARIRPGTIARRARGGYRVDGSKVFISNGHVSSWHVVVCCEDRSRAPDTGVVLAVGGDARGFSLGALADKMGQKACVASELVFDDCFVPDELVAIDARQVKAVGGEPRAVFQQVIDYTVSTTRAGVGAFGAGVARGAYLAARAHARTPGPGGRMPAQDESVRMRLADMRLNAEVARLAWLESALANCEHGLFRALFGPVAFEATRALPTGWWSLLAPALDAPLTTRAMRRANLVRYPHALADRTSGLGSIAKLVGSDAAMANADLALELMGARGTRRDAGAEKRLRDAKLLQIYEGTNQLNRLNVFKCLVGTDWADVDPFE